MPHCPICSTPVEAGSRKCNKCGASFEAPSLGLLESRLSPAEESALDVPTWLVLLIGILSIGGAALGVTAVAALAGQGGTGVLGYVVLGVVALLYAFGAYCGVLALQRRFGWYRKNLVFWCLQVPIFATPLLSYAFAAGAHLSFWARANPWGVGTNFGLGSSFSINLFTDGPLRVGVNVFAMGVVALLMRVRSKSAV
jgi:hypothetical protein